MGSEEAGLRAAGLWIHGRDDLLGVIGRHRDELTHSRIVGWLLDPVARHGLGTRLLAALLQNVFNEPFDHLRLDQARVRWEVPVAEGRMDIVITAPGLYLVIENKVDTDEGDGQVLYYMEHVTEPDARFILLSPDGRKAMGTDDCGPAKYSQIADMLEAALAVTPGTASGRPIAVEYLRTLRREFS
jgi:hypothetical protein